MCYAAVPPCDPSPCGPGALCSAVGESAVCACPAGTSGDAAGAGCRPECVVSSECPRDRSCVRNRCIDPCVGACGNGAECRVFDHAPICSCPPPTTGDPFFDCRLGGNILATNEIKSKKFWVWNPISNIIQPIYEQWQKLIFYSRFVVNTKKLRTYIHIARLIFFNFIFSSNTYSKRPMWSKSMCTSRNMSQWFLQLPRMYCKWRLLWWSSLHQSKMFRSMRWSLWSECNLLGSETLCSLLVP